MKLFPVVCYYGWARTNMPNFFKFLMLHAYENCQKIIIVGIPCWNSFDIFFKTWLKISCMDKDTK